MLQQACIWRLVVYTLIRTLPLRAVLFEQLPTLGVSLVIAEVFYKFHSFLLESIAFLFTWYALDGLRAWAVQTLRPDTTSAAAPKR
jgi:hypothetical protein